jgi:hypothetical protein
MVLGSWGEVGISGQALDTYSNGLENLVVSTAADFVEVHGLVRKH